MPLLPARLLCPIPQPRLEHVRFSPTNPKHPSARHPKVGNLLYMRSKEGAAS